MSSDNKNPFSEASYWDCVSGGYSKVASLVMEPFSLKAMELLDVNVADHAIDVACGTGTLCLPLAKRVDSVVAVDFSHQMVSQLDTTLRINKVGNIQVLQCDGQNLPFEENRFDVGFSMFGLMFFPDRLKGFGELYRVVKPKAKVAVSSWAPLEKSSLMMLLSKALQAGFPDSPSPRKNSMALGNPQDFKIEMKQGGFKNTVINESTSWLPPLAPKVLWETMSEGGPLLIIKQNLGEKKWAEVSKKAIEYLINEVGESGKELYTTAYIAVAEKGS